jgi:hypothetical protein
VVSFKPLPPYPGYPFYREVRLGGPQSQSGRYGEVKIFYTTGTLNPAPPGRPARSQSLYRLSYPGKLLYFQVLVNVVIISHFHSWIFKYACAITMMYISIFWSIYLISAYEVNAVSSICNTSSFTTYSYSQSARLKPILIRNVAINFTSIQIEILH